MNLLTVTLAAVALLLAAAAGYTRYRVAGIERAYPPQGSFVDAAGTRIHVIAAGEDRKGVPFVLLHGASGNAREPMHRLGRALAEFAPVYAIDRPGAGYSARPDRDGADTAAGQAGIVAATLDALGLEKAVIVGHSLGGAPAAALALAHPEKVAGLVLISAVTHPWPGGVTWYYELASLPLIGPLFAHTLVVPIGDASMDGAVEGVFRPDPAPAGYAAEIGAELTLRPSSFLANARDLTALKRSVTAQYFRYHEIAAPTLIITGDSDGSVSPKIHSRTMHEQVEGSRLVILKGAGHMPHDAHTARVAGEIRALYDTLEQIPPTGGVHSSR